MSLLGSEILHQVAGHGLLKQLEKLYQTCSKVFTVDKSGDHLLRLKSHFVLVISLAIASNA